MTFLIPISEIIVPLEWRARVILSSLFLEYTLEGGQNRPLFEGSQQKSGLGSGSFEKDSPLEIVAKEKEKEQKTHLVHHLRLGKRHRHAHKTGESSRYGDLLPARLLGLPYPSYLRHYRK